MVKVGIFGIGSIGSVLLKYLQENDSNDCFCFTRNDKIETKVLFQNKLNVIPFVEQRIKGFALDSNFDWLIICLKEYHYDDAFMRILQHVNPNTKLAIFRNGLRLGSIFEKCEKVDEILETIIDCPTQLNDRGEYVQFRKPKITLPTGKLADEFVKLFGLSDIEFIESNTFKTDQWKKLIESASLGAIQTLTLQPCVIFENPKWLELYKKLIDEGIAVANSDEIELGPVFKAELLARLKAYPPDKGSSMLSDKLAGKQIELEAKTGAIVLVGAENKVNIPATLEIYSSLLNDSYKR